VHGMSVHGSCGGVHGSNDGVHGSNGGMHHSNGGVTPWTAVQVAYGRSCLVVFVGLPPQGLLPMLQAAAGRQHHVSLLAANQP
jgi:hypothetical protein